MNIDVDKHSTGSTLWGQQNRASYAGNSIDLDHVALHVEIPDDPPDKADRSESFAQELHIQDLPMGAMWIGDAVADYHSCRLPA